MASFKESGDVKKVAEELINAHRTDLIDCRLRYYVTDTISFKNSKMILGSTKKLSGLLKQTLDADFVIIVPVSVWNNFSPVKQKALLHHEISHIVPCTKKEKNGTEYQTCDKEGNLKWSLIGHDLEEFSHIIKLYGNWHEDIENFREDIKGAPGSTPLTIIKGGKGKKKPIDSEKLDEEFEKAQLAEA